MTERQNADLYFDPLATIGTDTSAIQSVVRRERDLYEEFMAEHYLIVDEYMGTPRPLMTVSRSDLDNFDDVVPVGLIPDEHLDMLRRYTEAKDAERVQRGSNG